MRKLPIIPDDLPAGIEDVGAKGSQEIQGRAGGGGTTVRAGAGMPARAIVGDLTALPVVVQTIQGNRRVNAIAGVRLMVVGRHGLALKYRESRMTPREQEIEQSLSDFISCRQAFQEFVAKQEHDLNRSGAGDRDQ